MMRQKQTTKTYDPGWLFLLVLVASLFGCLVASQPLRYQIGGKWSLPLVGAALIATIYLQPPIQQHIKRWRADQRDEAEKRWWRDRDKREQQALLRAEAIREGKIKREELRKKKK